MSVDPLSPSYPAWTPYAFAMNCVINGSDLDGLEWNAEYFAKAEYKPVLKASNFWEGAYNAFGNVTTFAQNVTVDVINSGIGVHNTSVNAMADPAAAAKSLAETSKSLAETFNPHTFIQGLGNADGRQEVLDDLGAWGSDIHNLESLTAGFLIAKGLSYAAPKAGHGVLKPESNVKSPISGGALSATEFEALKAQTQSNFISVFHKGELVGGKVAKGKNLSTGLEKSSVEALDRAGKVHEFRIPQNVFDDWLNNGNATKLKDLDRATGVYNQEVRFSGNVSEQLNTYKVE